MDIKIILKNIKNRLKTILSSQTDFSFTKHHKIVFKNYSLKLFFQKYFQKQLPNKAIVQITHQSPPILNSHCIILEPNNRQGGQDSFPTIKLPLGFLSIPKNSLASLKYLKELSTTPATGDSLHKTPKRRGKREQKASTESLLSKHEKPPLGLMALQAY